jgi:hypothetical protein
MIRLAVVQTSTRSARFREDLGSHEDRVNTCKTGVFAGRDSRSVHVDITHALQLLHAPAR